MFLAELFSSGAIGTILKKMVPWLIGLGIMIGSIYFGYEYISTMKEQVTATQAALSTLKEQNEQIKAANVAIVADMKGVKELTDNFNTRLLAIRSNSNALTNVVSSTKFKTTVTTDVKASQDQLNQSFNDYYTKLNGVTNGQ
jgi:hypothetical protein